MRVMKSLSFWAQNADKTLIHLHVSHHLLPFDHHNLYIDIVNTWVFKNWDMLWLHLNLWQFELIAVLVCGFRFRKGLMLYKFQSPLNLSSKKWPPSGWPPNMDILGSWSSTQYLCFCNSLFCFLFWCCHSYKNVKLCLYIRHCRRLEDKWDCCIPDNHPSHFGIHSC